MSIPLKPTGRLAYNMMGSVADAEDAVQESFLRWRRVDEREVTSPKAYLTAVVTRLCMDQLRSARAQREMYVGPWLPEPLVEAGETTEQNDPLIMQEALSTAMLVLLERLNPVERSVFLLHDVFGFTYSEIATIVDRTEVNCRQVGSRARRFIRSGRPRFEPSSAQKEQLRGFLRASMEGDMKGLLTFLRQDVVMHSDGGGKVTAARHPVEGVERVARFLLGLRKFDTGEYTVALVRVNGEPGVIVRMGSAPFMVVSASWTGDEIAELYVVVNPDKLTRVPGPQPTE